MIFRHVFSLLLSTGLISNNISAASPEQSFHGFFGHHGNNSSSSSPSWTLSHSHDIECAVKKMKQSGFTVFNDINNPLPITLTGQIEGQDPESISQIVPPLGSIRFPGELKYTGIIHPKSKSVYSNLVPHQDLETGIKIFDIRLSHIPMPFGQFGIDGFGFDFNYLKYAPLHRTPHQIHPTYINEDGSLKIGSTQNDLYEAMKRAERKLERAQTPEAEAKAARKLFSAQEDWRNWLKDYAADGTEERREFLEDDEILYSTHVIRPYDPTVGPRQEQRFKELLAAKEAFDTASVEGKNDAFARLATAKMAWRKWAAQYNGNVWFLENRVLQGTGITLNHYKTLLNTHYERHNPGKMLSFLRDHPVSIDHRKIPGNTHTLWFTHPNNPKEFPYAESLKRSSIACPADQGFVHNLWVLDKRLMPLTMESLDDRMHQTTKYGFGAPVIVREFSEFGDFDLKSFVEDSIYNKRKMGMATDAFRAVLLEKEGGIYMDADFEMLQSVSPWLNYYDGVFSLEPMSSFVGNAHFMVRPHHPVMQEIVRIITRNVTAETTPAYINDVLKEDPTYATISITGPGALTEAVAKKLGSHRGDHDVVLTHPFFYPSVNNIYPEKDVQKSTQGLTNTFDATAWGVHKWHTTWDKVEFGSKG